jgi:hypothetical protein
VGIDPVKGTISNLRVQSSSPPHAILGKSIVLVASVFSTKTKNPKEKKQEKMKLKIMSSV